MNVTLAIQARLGSSRLPQKALKSLFGKPLFENLVIQLRDCQRISTLALATSDSPSEKALIQLATELGLSVHTGPVDDIITRLNKCAKDTGCDILVRIWGDCPFICPDIVDKMVAELIGDDLDFLNNEKYPGGLDVEIYSARLLEQMNAAVRDIKLREFPVEYVKASGVKHGTYLPTETIENAHLTIDYAEDLAAAEKIYSILKGKGRVFKYHDLVMLFTKQPELLQLFSRAERNIEYNAYLNSKKGPE